MRTAKQMDVILIRPNRFHLDRKLFRNLGSRFLDNRRHPLIQQRLPVFHGKNNVVVDLPRTVAPFLTASSLCSAILQRVPEKIVPVASYGELQVDVVSCPWQINSFRSLFILAHIFRHHR